MPFFSLKNLSLFLFTVSDKITSAFGVSSKFSIIDHVIVNRSSEVITIQYNQTLIPYTLSKCHTIHGSFSVDDRGHDHPTPFNTSLDLFSWGIHGLSSVFQSVLDKSILSARCLLTVVGEFAKHTLFCNTTNANLSVFYNSPYPYRTDPIGFFNNNASVVLCKAGENGFLVAGYQPDWSPLTPSIPIVPIETHSTGFNPLWAIPLVAGSALLLVMLIPRARKAMTASIADCYCRWRGEKRISLLELSATNTKSEGYGSAQSISSII